MFFQRKYVFRVIFIYYVLVCTNDNLHALLVLNMYLHTVEHMYSGILFYNILRIGIVYK